LEDRLKVQAFEILQLQTQQYCPKFKRTENKNNRNHYTEIVHHFFSTVINGIEQVANENGYSVIICLSDDSFDKEVLNMEMLLLMEALTDS
jgi:LacI family transcriptional regulator